MKKEEPYSIFCVSRTPWHAILPMCLKKASNGAEKSSDRGLWTKSWLNLMFRNGLQKARGRCWLVNNHILRCLVFSCPVKNCRSSGNKGHFQQLSYKLDVCLRVICSQSKHFLEIATTVNHLGEMCRQVSCGCTGMFASFTKCCFCDRLNPMGSCWLKMFSCGTRGGTRALLRQLWTTPQLQLTLW